MAAGLSDVDRHISQTNERLQCIKQQMQLSSEFTAAARELIDWCSDDRAFQKHFEKSLLECLTIAAAQREGTNAELAFQLISICHPHREKFHPRANAKLTQWYGELQLAVGQLQSTYSADGYLMDKAGSQTASGLPMSNMHSMMYDTGQQQQQMNGHQQPQMNCHPQQQINGHQQPQMNGHQQPQLNVVATVWGGLHPSGQPQYQQADSGYMGGMAGYPQQGQPMKAGYQMTNMPGGTDGKMYNMYSGQQQQPGNYGYMGGMDGSQNGMGIAPPGAAAAAAYVAAAATATATATATASMVALEQQQMGMYSQQAHQGMLQSQYPSRRTSPYPPNVQAQMQQRRQQAAMAAQSDIGAEVTTTSTTQPESEYQNSGMTSPTAYKSPSPMSMGGGYMGSPMTTQQRVMLAQRGYMMREQGYPAPQYQPQPYQHGYPGSPGAELHYTSPHDIKPIIPAMRLEDDEKRLTFPVAEGLILPPFRLEHNLAVSNHVFHLRDTIFQTLASRGDLQLELKCFHHEDRLMNTNWPASVTVNVNGSPLPIERGENNSRHRPLYLKHVCKPGKNTLQITVTSCCCSHLFVVKLVHRPTVAMVLEQLHKRRKLPAEHCVKKYKSLLASTLSHRHPSSIDPQSPSADTYARVSLICPFSGRRIQLPARGYHCRHVQCFDLEKYLEQNCCRSTFRCPICDQPSPLEQLEIDDFIWDILKSTNVRDINEIIIDSEGQWKAMTKSEPMEPTQSSWQRVPFPESGGYQQMMSPMSYQNPHTPGGSLQAPHTPASSAHSPFAAPASVNTTPGSLNGVPTSGGDTFVKLEPAVSLGNPGTPAHIVPNPGTPGHLSQPGTPAGHFVSQSQILESNSAPPYSVAEATLAVSATSLPGPIHGASTAPLSTSTANNTNGAPELPTLKQFDSSSAGQPDDIENIINGFSSDDFLHLLDPGPAPPQQQQQSGPASSGDDLLTRLLAD